MKYLTTLGNSGTLAEQPARYADFADWSIF